VTADDGGATNNIGSDEIDVTVNNVAPTVHLSGATSADEGQTKTYTYTVSDPGTDPNPTISEECGTYGSYANTLAANSFDCTFPDGPASSTVKVTADDHDPSNNVGLDYINVSIANVAPHVVLSGANSANEGQTKTYTYIVSDPGNDPNPTITESCGANGTRTDTPAADSFDCTFPDGPASSNVRVEADDHDPSNNVGFDQIAVAVANLAPTASFSNNGPVDEGSSFTIQLTSPSDLSSADTNAGFQYAFDCGSGYGAYGSSTSRSCPTTDNGTRSVKGKIKDKDGGVNEYTASVNVNNVAPHITSVTATNTYAGPLVFMTSSISTLFTDPGSADTWINYLTFSDGGAETSTTQPAAQGGDSYKFTLTHSFVTPGCKTVTSRVNDDDGASNTFGPTPVNVGSGEFLPPVTNTPVTNKLKNGQVLPVKIKLTDCTGAPITNLNPAIVLKKGDLTSVGDDGVIPITPGSVSAADTTGFMRSSGDGSYIYNMSVNITLNTDYTIIIYPFGTGTPSQYLAHVIQATK
jgi:hypothetical protein